MDLNRLFPGKGSAALRSDKVADEAGLRFDKVADEAGLRFDKVADDVV